MRLLRKDEDDWTYSIAIGQLRLVEYMEERTTNPRSILFGPPKPLSACAEPSRSPYIHWQRHVKHQDLRYRYFPGTIGTSNFSEFE